MKDKDKSVKGMWERYLMTIGENPESTEMTYQSWCFCDNQGQKCHNSSFQGHK
ncbi:hypothetical protein [Proteocatella sphenisci]|uniref:hypothetical protein n=1 Tax=Proteocatella sphenisci TaxID=181070 RepID=UPI0004AEB3B0|nr:hypothetical protein [Proteocatella sphenisci]